MSTKVRYAVRAMLELALACGATAGGDVPSVSSRDVARRQHVSEKYVGQLLAQLRTAGLVRSTRGQRGGFRLARPAAEISLLDIVLAFEGTLAPVACVDDPDGCGFSATCAAREVWCELKDSIEKPLKRRTLADLARQERRLRPTSP